MVVYGAVMFALLFTRWEQWAADHSIASFVSATDKRLNNSISTTVDRPISIVGDVVLMVSGLWIGILVPHLLKKFKAGYQSPADQTHPIEPQVEY